MQWNRSFFLKFMRYFLNQSLKKKSSEIAEKNDQNMKALLTFTVVVIYGFLRQNCREFLEFINYYMTNLQNQKK